MRFGEFLHRDPLVISPDDTLDEALEALTSQRVSWAPVVDAEGWASVFQSCSSACIWVGCWENASFS
ncbi:MAG: CBS domain-containing protein [Ktedonobacteraceae bacterium]